VLAQVHVARVEQRRREERLDLRTLAAHSMCTT
jgi:hypothetical protein